MDWRSVALYSDHKLSPLPFHFHSISNLPVLKVKPKRRRIFLNIQPKDGATIEDAALALPCTVRLFLCRHVVTWVTWVTLGDAGAAVESQCVGCAEFQT